MSVYVNGSLSYKTRTKRAIRNSSDGDYVFLCGRHKVIWRGGVPTVDVYRTSMFSMSRGDSPESTRAYAGRRQGVLPQVQHRDDLVPS